MRVENNRLLVENIRVRAENIRVRVENNRVLDKNIRVRVENVRVRVENIRVRVENFVYASKTFVYARGNLYKMQHYKSIRLQAKLLRMEDKIFAAFSSLIPPIHTKAKPRFNACLLNTF